jgi:hypothetical protein
MDILRIVLILDLVALAVAAFCTITLAWSSTASQNIGLASATLLAAMLLFILQMFYEYREDTSTHRFFSEITIDVGAKRIGEDSYLKKEGGSKYWAEANSSDWLAANNPTAFLSNRDKLTRDAALFYVVSFFINTQYDWKTERIVWKGKLTDKPNSSMNFPLDTDCTVINENEFRQALKSAGNMFADAPLRFLPPFGVRLPPNTRFTSSPDRLSIANPFCKITFSVELSNIMTQMSPPAVTPLSASQIGPFENRVVSVNTEVTYLPLRSKHRSRPLYERWVARLLADMKEWFS